MSQYDKNGFKLDETAFTQTAQAVSATQVQGTAKAKANSRLKAFVGLSVALLAGAGISYGVVQWMAKTGQANANVPVTTSQNANPVGHAEQRLPPSRIGPSAQAIQAWAQVGTRSYALTGGQISLSSGSTLVLQASSPIEGVLTVRTINPDGKLSTAPLWTGYVKAGEKISTQQLRLVGTRGKETIVLSVTLPDGRQLAERAVSLWHI
jgi:hypothetical protein